MIKFLINQHNLFPFKRVKDICPLPGAGENHPLPLLLPLHIQIEDDLLNGGPFPTRRSGKKSSVVRLRHERESLFVFRDTNGKTKKAFPVFTTGTDNTINHSRSSGRGREIQETNPVIWKCFKSIFFLWKCSSLYKLSIWCNANVKCYLI